MSPQTSPTQIPAPQLSKRRQAVLILAPYCSQRKNKHWNPQNRWQRRHFKYPQIILWVENRSWLQVIENGSKQELRLLPISLFLITINFCCVLTRITKKVHILEIGMYNLYSYISLVTLNIDVRNTEEQWLLNLLRNRIIHVNCSHKGYWHGLFSSLLALETIFTNPTSNRRLKMSPNRSFKVKKKNLSISRGRCMLMYLVMIVSNSCPRIW